MSLPRSDQELLLLHNPRCSKSRATLALLEEKGVDFEVRCYLDEPLSIAELHELAQRMGRPVGEWVRKGEAVFEQAGLAPDSDDRAVLEAMAAHPILMERPVLVSVQAARIGRPPESVLELLAAT